MATDARAGQLPGAPLGPLADSIREVDHAVVLAGMPETHVTRPGTFARLAGKLILAVRLLRYQTYYNMAQARALHALTEEVASLAWRLQVLERAHTETLGKAPEYDYQVYWTPATEAEARALIIDPYPSDEAFEASGQADAARIKDLAPSRDSTLLEFGCGVGRVMRYLTEYRRVYGVDVSEQMLAFARRRVPGGNVDFLRVEGLRLPLPQASIDFLYSLFVLQHIDRKDVRDLIREFRRVVRPGGLLYLQFPEEGDGEEGRMTRPYTLDDVRELLRGFHLVSLERLPLRDMVAGFASHPEASRWISIYAVAERR